ncbi:immunoglobulin-like domain-containing protein, partial [Spongiivirga citrea]
MRQVIQQFKKISIFILVLTIFGCNEDDFNLPKVVSGFTFTLNEDTGTVKFINISEKATKYEWDFGDGTSSTEINPIKTYETGTYTITLKAMNVAGASDTFEDEITVLIPEVVALPITFDGANVNYEAGLFGGTSFDVVDNPAPGGTNDVASKVGAITNSGAAFEGIFFDLGAPIDLATEKTIKMNFWSESAIDVLLKLEEGSAASIETVVSHGGSGWEEILFSFTDAAAYERLTLFVDGPGTTAGTFYIDDIVQVETPVPPFDSGLLTNGDFENGDDPWIGGGRNIVTEGDNSFNLVDVTTAGNPFDVNLSQVVELTQGTNYILTFDASSDRARTMLAGIGLNVDPFTNTAPSVNLTTETQTFTLQLAANDFGGADSRVLFDMGAEVGTVVIDNVSLVEGGDGSDTNGGGGGFDSGLITNGDFENGDDPWIGGGRNIVTEGGNSFNLVDVMTAGNPFDVNLSQVVAITQGESYILKFDASSDRTRTMLAGIGLNEAPFTNTSQSVSLTTDTQTFTLMLTATDFGGANSRILFDMGAEVGTVVIDNVSLMLDDSGSGDTEAPVITLNGDATIEVTQGETFTDPGATATDNVDGDISGNITVGGDTVDTGTVGTYTITYNVSDAAGNAATEVTRTVNVVAGAGGDAPTTAAPTPPTRDAGDVISLFSNAYTDITVDTFYAGFSAGGGLTDVQVAGD